MDQFYHTFLAGELFENPYMCAVCNVPFDTPGEVLQHVNVVHLQINLECRYCGVVFQVGSTARQRGASPDQPRVSLLWGRVPGRFYSTSTWCISRST